MTHGDATIPPAAPAPATAPAPAATTGYRRYPVDVQVQRPRSSEKVWAVLYLLFGVKSFVLILHLLLFWVLSLGLAITFFVAQIVVLVTGRLPGGMFRFMLQVVAQTNRLNGWLMGLRDEFPPFWIGDEPYPIVTVVAQPPRSSRLWALLTILLVKFVLLLPHMVVLYALGIAQSMVVLVAQVLILVNGEYHEGLYDFVRGVMRWQTRVMAFTLGLCDDYPPFSLR